MTEMTADLAQKTNQNGEIDHGVSAANCGLDCRYGQIGILAVVAAVRYQGATKNLAYAPTSNSWRDRYAEVAA